MGQAMTPAVRPSNALARIEIRDFQLITRIGTYAPGDTVPDQHLLDLTLWIDSALVLITQDSMAHVFDYDPLVREIEKLAADGHFETQEHLITRIVDACLAHQAIDALEIALRKSPVRPGSGSLGVRLSLHPEQMRQRRGALALPDTQPA